MPAETVLEMATALWRFWQVRGHLAEGRQRLAQLLAVDDVLRAGLGLEHQRT